MGFGSFDFICEQAALPLCALVGTSTGIEPICYARNVELANTLIFQAGNPSPPTEYNSDVYSNRLYPYRRLDNDNSHDLPRSIEIYSCRTQRNHHVLLLVHGSHSHLSHPRLGSRASFVGCVSVLCRCAMRINDRDVLVSPRQRIRRLSIRRRRNSPLLMGILPLTCNPDSDVDSYSDYRHLEHS